jgi:murein peptide amidase A
MLPRRADRPCDDAQVRRLGWLLCAGLLLGVPVPQATAAGGQVKEETVRIGTSVLGRPILAVHRFTEGATQTSGSTLVVGSMHGDERAGMRVVRRLRSAPLPEGVDLWLVRTMNPDGTVADRRTNAHGVDLNRNFPRYWAPAGWGTSTWSGPAPASEPETRAMTGFLRDVRPRTTLVFHQPLYGVDSYRAKSMSLVRRLSRETGLPISEFDCTGGCHGTLTDWHNSRLEGRAVTIELGRTASDDEVARVSRGLLRVAAPL